MKFCTYKKLSIRKLHVLIMFFFAGEKFPVVDPTLEEYISRVSKLAPDSKYLLAGQGFTQLCNKKFTEARDCFARGRNIDL